MTISRPRLSPEFKRRRSQAGGILAIQPPRRAMAKQDVHYGWVVAAATFVVMLATAGAMGAPGVFIEPAAKGIRLERGGHLLRAGGAACFVSA